MVVKRILLAKIGRAGLGREDTDRPRVGGGGYLVVDEYLLPKIGRATLPTLPTLVALPQAGYPTPASEVDFQVQVGDNKNMDGGVPQEYDMGGMCI